MSPNSSSALSIQTVPQSCLVVEGYRWFILWTLVCLAKLALEVECHVHDPLWCSVVFEYAGQGSVAAVCGIPVDFVEQVVHLVN